MNLWGQPILSDLLAGGYIGLLLLMWGALLLGVPLWGRRWTIAPPDPAAGPPAAGPRVSICIPARNEAENIGVCVAQALASRWPSLEVVVVDDRSEDDTGRVARAAGEGDARLFVVEGSEPQAGWAGKPWACARAAGEARGELLLFLDADVRIHPDAVAALVDVMERDRLGMLSIFGTWELVTFWERALIPTVGWLIRGAVNLDQINDPVRPEAFANGQLILVRREAYDRMGGHQAVRDQILEDVRLAQVAKKHGVATGMRVAPWAFRVRLYRSLGEIVRGYSKNLYEGMGRNPLVGLGAVLFILVGTLVPFLALLGGLWARSVWGWAVPGNGWLVALAGVCALQLAFRWRSERADGRSGAIAWTHPIANVLLVVILLRSMFGVRTVWKGRTFSDGRATS